MKTLSLLKWLLIGVGLSVLALVLLATPAPVAAGLDVWTGQYYSNSSLAGSPTFTRLDDTIDFNWGYDSPDSRIPDDHFSVRWTMRTYFDEGRYRFRTRTDDGVRLYVDGNLVIDQWHDMSASTNSATVNLARGYHQIRMEYYENQGVAVAKLSWMLAPGRSVGNIITCVRPSNSWIKVYRWQNGSWVDLIPRGVGASSPNGFLKLDGMAVDEAYSGSGQPYRVELWAGGTLIRSVGNTAAGQPEFRVYAWEDNYTPWGCPAP